MGPELFQQEPNKTVEAEFSLDVATPQSSIPAVVLTRVFGKQKPITPHAQRLLVAARKEARAPKPKTSSEGKGKGRGKGRGKGKASKARGAKPKTPYSLAKDEFMNKLLLVLMKRFVSSFGSQINISKPYIASW